MAVTEEDIIDTITKAVAALSVPLDELAKTVSDLGASHESLREKHNGLAREYGVLSDRIKHVSHVSDARADGQHEVNVRVFWLLTALVAATAFALGRQQ